LLQYAKKHKALTLLPILNVYLQIVIVWLYLRKKREKPVGKKALSTSELEREGEKGRTAKLGKDSKIGCKGAASRWPKKPAGKRRK